MFQVPHAKRVKRSELLDQDEQGGSREDSSQAEGNSESEDPTAAAEAIDYGFEYDFISPPTAPRSTLNDTPAEPEDESYEFRLFAPASKKSSSAPQLGQGPSISATTARKIIVARSPSPSFMPTISESRLVRPRPESHYFAQPTTASQRQYSKTAISATTIIALSHTPWPGTSLPWRVTHIPSITAPRTQDSQAPKHTKPSTRSKPNKKRRIILRRRLAVRAALTTKTKPKSVVRSETGEILSLDPVEREKRSARNREKKLKRRQREREKKAALAGGEAVEREDGSGGVGDGGSDDSVAGGD